MSSMSKVTDLLRDASATPGLSNDAILEVIRPTDLDGDHRKVQEPRFPVYETSAWRLQSPIGAELWDNHTVRANFFQVKGSEISGTIHQYSVKIFPYMMKTGAKREEDCATKVRPIPIPIPNPNPKF